MHTFGRYNKMTIVQVFTVKNTHTQNGIFIYNIFENYTEEKLWSFI